MSEEKGLAFTDMLEEFFTPRIDAALSQNETPEAGFYPPEGSTFNADSSVVTLPSVQQNSDYNQSISFYATEEISIPDVGSFGFVSANITSVSILVSCILKCNFQLYVTLTLQSAGSYEIHLQWLSVLDADLCLYNGENPILNNHGTDYSALNSFVPTYH